MEQQLLLFELTEPEVIESTIEETVEVTEPNVVEPTIEETVEVIEEDETVELTGPELIVEEPVEVTESDETVIQEDSNALGNNSLGNLLTKFDAIDLAGEQRISAEELEYCQFNEKIYLETVDVLKRTTQDITTLYEKYKDLGKENCRYDGANFLSRYSDLDFGPKRLKEVYKDFIHRIVYYFTKRYNVTLNSSDIEKKYDTDTISYSAILDEIFEQLGGLTFKEKAVAEIKAASKNTIYKTSNITITKNKLAIADFVWWHTSWDNSLSVSYGDNKVNPLFLALSHFISGEVSISYGLQNIYQQLNRGSKDYDIFAKYELPNNVLQALKFYKNGKVELFFADNTKAEEFKNQYLV